MRSYQKLLLVLCTTILSCLYAQGSSSTPVTVNSISCSAGTCTVTTVSAHNIPANNPGLLMAGGPAGDVGAFTAATVPTTTTYTVVSSTMVTCSSSCGTAQPGPNFIILGNPFNGQLGLQSVTVCYWNYIQTPLPIANKTSACSAAFNSSVSPGTAALSSINTALAAGIWFESSFTLNFASSDTRAQIEQEFQRVQFAAQNQIVAGIQFGRDIGTICDAVGCNQ